jgi:hypothetical protein
MASSWQQGSARENLGSGGTEVINTQFEINLKITIQYPQKKFVP